MDWTDRLDAQLADYPPTRRALIGVSGGCDSVALLHLLVERGYRKLVVCHLHHGLRGRAAEADARFVGRLAAKLGLVAEIAAADVRGAAREHGMSLEEAGRAARLQFFARVARSTRARTLFLAHHADDQVETFLQRLLRGAGARGLGGMAAEAQWGTLRVVRPLLHVWRRELQARAEEAGWKWREDASNTDRAHTRNRVRHDLLPALEAAAGREVRATLWRTAEILRAEDEWLGALTEDVLAAQQSPLAVGALRSMPRALQRRLLGAWLGHFVEGVGFAHIEAARALLEPDAEGHPAKANLPAGFHVRRSAGRLWVQAPAA